MCAGNGLFAKTDISKGTKIADYTVGTTPLSKSQLDAKYTKRKPTHVWQKSNTYYDASNLKRSVAGAVNRASKGYPQNVRLKASGGAFTTKKVAAGKELFINYGRSFVL